MYKERDMLQNMSIYFLPGLCAVVIPFIIPTFGTLLIFQWKWIAWKSYKFMYRTHIHNSYTIHGFLFYLMTHNLLLSLLFDLQIVLNLASGNPSSYLLCSLRSLILLVTGARFILSSSTLSLKSVISVRRLDSLLQKEIFTNEALGVHRSCDVIYCI